MRLTDCDTILGDIHKPQWHTIPNTLIKGMLMYDMPMIQPNYILRCAYRNKFRLLARTHVTILLDDNFVSEGMSKILKSFCRIQSSNTRRRCDKPSPITMSDFNLYASEDDKVRSATIHINNYISDFWEGVYDNDMCICTIRYVDLNSYREYIGEDAYYRKIFEDFLKK